MYVLSKWTVKYKLRVLGYSLCFPVHFEITKDLVTVPTNVLRIKVLPFTIRN